MSIHPFSELLHLILISLAKGTVNIMFDQAEKLEAETNRSLFLNFWNAEQG